MFQLSTLNIFSVLISSGEVCILKIVFFNIRLRLKEIIDGLDSSIG